MIIIKYMNWVISMAKQPDGCQQRNGIGVYLEVQ